eukprot:Em0018g581a
MESNSEKQQDENAPELSSCADKQLRLLKRCRIFVETVTICTIVGSVWALLSLPTVFYFLPTPEQAPTQNTKLVGCVNYTKSVCLQALIQREECLFEEFNNSSDVYITTSVDQEANENTAQLIINGLSLLGTTETCRSSFIPFLCLYLFPLCDENGTVSRPSRDQCIEVSTVACIDEWQKALSIPYVKQQLPDCESLPATSYCQGVNATVAVQNTTTMAPNSTHLSCRDSFFLLNGSCHPMCNKWKQYSSDAISNSIDAIVIISAAAGLAMGIVVVICSAVKRRTMFAFPSVIIPYMAMTSVGFAAFILISLMDREALFCSSQDLLEAMKTPTAFCSFIGSVYYYALLQLAIWWICHVAALFWKVKFPFHAKAFSNVKFVHIMVVVAALLLPVAPVISAFVTGGFTIGSFPPLLCVTKNGNAIYFTLILPISLIVAIGTTLLIIILATILKRSNFMEQHGNQTMRTAERKIFLILCYYVVLASVALAAFSINTATGKLFVQNVINYFACEAGGIKQICDSQRKEFESFINPGVNMVTYILLGALPSVNLAYIVNFNKLLCVQFCKTKRSSTQQSTSPESATTE